MPLTDFAFLLKDLAIAFGEPCRWRMGEFVVRFRIDPFTVPVAPTEAGLYVTETWAYAERSTIPRGRRGELPDLGNALIIRDWAWEIVEVGDDDLGERQFRLLRRELAPTSGWVEWDEGETSWDFVPDRTRWGDVVTWDDGATAWDEPERTQWPDVIAWDDGETAWDEPSETLWPDDDGPGFEPGAAVPEPPPPPWEDHPRDAPLAPDEAEQVEEVFRPPGRPTRRAEIAEAYGIVRQRVFPGTPLAHMYGPIREEITGRSAPSPGLSDKTIAAIVRDMRLHR